MSRKLFNWWELKGFAEFRSEIKKHYKGDIPLKERSEWEALFLQEKRVIEACNAEIARDERAIDVAVYKLFGLTDAEQKAIEASLAVH